MTQTHITRRTVLAGAAASIPVAMTTSLGAVAASTGPRSLAVELGDPAARTDTWAPVMDTPVYRSDLKTRRALACLPRSITVRNTGETPVTSASGTVEVAMHDYVTDVRPPFGAHQLKIASQQANFTLTERGSDFRTGSKWEWSYTGVIAPGAAVTLPWEYWVRTPFWNVQFQVLVTATVVDDDPDAPDNVSQKIGQSPSFTA